VVTKTRVLAGEEMFNVEEVRGDFPILQRRINGVPLIYFDNTATTQKPRRVMEAILDFYENHNANIHRGIHTLSQEASEMYEEAHDKIAKFIGANGREDIVFVRNTTEGINVVAYGWALHRLKAGDEILTSKIEHHSNMVPWQIISKITGAKMAYADVDEDGVVTAEKISEKITKKTRIISVNHVSNVLGVINPVREIGKLAEENDAILIVDGAQSVPHMPVDVEELGVEFMAFSAHKMLGPTGIGALYGRGDLLDEMDPFLGGGDMIREVYLERFTTTSPPWKFEAGTPNIAGGIGFSAAIDYLERLGMREVKDYEAKLTRYLLDELVEFDKVSILGSDDPQSRIGLVSFNVEGLNPHDVAALFDLEGIAIRSGHHCAQPLHRYFGVESSARASFYVYNTRKEIDRFLEVLNKIQEMPE
jgi:cysteine desulfurase/selenocysteine lyase